MVCVLIVAGGMGSRFWPKSTEEKPKQFLKLFGDETMIQMTYNRMRKIVSDDYIFVVTNRRYVRLLKTQLPNIKDSNIIIEPFSKSTGPCILLSSLYIKKRYPDTNIVCVTSDSYIGKEKALLNNIKLASDFVNKEQKAIVMVGTLPKRLETNYGYIKYEKNKNVLNRVLQFIEKPNIELVKGYLASGEYLWNTGIYIYHNESMLKEIKNNLPSEYQLLKDLPDINDSKYNEYLDNNYSKCQTISLEYTVMQKSVNLYTIASNIDWDDVGSWEALMRYTKKDNDGNVIKGNAKVINSHNNIIYGNDKRIILVNTDDLFCIDSDETIIIGHKEDFNKVHLLKDEIERDTD